MQERRRPRLKLKPRPNPKSNVFQNGLDRCLISPKLPLPPIFSAMSFNLNPALITIILLGIMVAFFLVKSIPHYIVALSGALALGLLGIVPMNSLFSGFANPILILFCGMFVIGDALFQTGLASEVGIWAVRKMGKNERLLLWGTMVSAGLLSTVASNTGTTVALMPVAMSLALSAQIPISKLLMPLAFATGFGGFSALIGTPPNMIVSEALGQAGFKPFAFFEFAWVGIPLAIAGMLYLDLFGMKLLSKSAQNISPVKKANFDSTTISEKKVWKMWVCAGILLLVIVLMTMNLKSISLESIAVVGAILCVVTGCISSKQALESIEWETVILFGAMFTVALAMEKSGAADLLARGLLYVLEPGSQAQGNPYWIIFILLVFTMALGTVLSNTASAVLMVPIGLLLAKETGANPRSIMMAIALAGSCSFLTPLGTPPNMIVWAPGGYRFSDFMKVGLGLSLVCIAVGVLIIPWKWPVF